jgi:hypothetical protein
MHKVTDLLDERELLIMRIIYQSHEIERLLKENRDLKSGRSIDQSNLLTHEDGIDKLFNLWKRTEEHVEELEGSYLTCHMQNEPVSVILVGLWRQTIPASELRKRFEKMLMDSPDVQRIDFDEKTYSFIPLK